MLKIAAEFFGTFIFLSVILYATAKNATWPGLTPILICVGLLAGISVSASTSGAHLNPAVSLMMYINKSLSLIQFGSYVSAQCVGAVAAVTLKSFLDTL
jgi:aquaporin Z